ncbi:HepT-like ribonuclease domain-containing protein [Leptospira koniambonensis]|uniref:HepT-like ribonuclease domain-containing protein n=1 Tax=Leptospira koniambonensis TaxID=2484950 RepID=UPI003EC07B3B
MPRDAIVLLEDILTSIDEIFEFLKEINSLSLYKQDTLRKRAVERNLEIIGEVVKKIPESIKTSNQDIEWRQIAGLRDFITHGYFEVDDEIIWNIVTNHLKPLKIRIIDIKNTI